MADDRCTNCDVCACPVCGRNCNDMADRIEALEAALRSLGFWQLSRDNENVGWHGVPKENRDLYACEFCRQEHEDFTLLEHKAECPITVIRALGADR